MRTCSLGQNRFNQSINQSSSHLCSFQFVVSFALPNIIYPYLHVHTSNGPIANVIYPQNANPSRFRPLNTSNALPPPNTFLSDGTIPIFRIVEVIGVEYYYPVNAHPSGGGAGVILVIANRQRDGGRMGSTALFVVPDSYASVVYKYPPNKSSFSSRIGSLRRSALAA